MGTTPVGHVPKIALPVTGIWLVPLAIYMLSLSFRTSLVRVSQEQFLGDKTVSSSSKPEADPLYVMVRAHGNFVENVPMAMLLSAAAELNGADSTTLGTISAAFFVARVLHAEGKVGPNAKSARPMRMVGVLGTLLSLSGLAVYNA